MKDQYITVVYRIVDASEWGKTNPLKYAHDGLKAHRVAIGNLADDRDALVAALEEIEKGGDMSSCLVANNTLYSLWKNK